MTREELIKWRKDHGFNTQEEFSRFIGIRTMKTIQNWESGRVSIPLWLTEDWLNMQVKK